MPSIAPIAVMAALQTSGLPQATPPGQAPIAQPARETVAAFSAAHLPRPGFGPDRGLFDGLVPAPAFAAPHRTAVLPEFKQGWRFFDTVPVAQPASPTSRLADGAPDEPAAAPAPQSADPASGRIDVDKSVFDGDYLIVMAGAVALPDYEGSDDRQVIPAAAIAGNFKGIGINPRAGGIALDVVPDKPGARVGISLGPVVKLRTNRSGKARDPVVASLGKLPKVVEVGFSAGLTIRQVFNPHDRMSVGADMRWDASGKGSGYIVSPSVSYLTPLSRAMVAGVLVSAEFADSRYAHYNYDVSAAGAVVSGLPAYSAHGGLKAVDYGFMLARDLNGNLLDGGLVVGAGVMYSHLYGSAAQSPIASIRGSSSQWVFGGGLGFVF